MERRPPKRRGRVLCTWPAGLLPEAKIHAREIADRLPRSLVFLRAAELDGDRVLKWDVVEVPGRED